MFDFIEKAGEYVVIFWREIYLFIFHMPWELKVLAPYELGIAALTQIYELLKNSVATKETIMVSIAMAAPIVGLIQRHDYVQTEKHFFFSPFKIGSKAHRNYRFTKAIVLMILSPAWLALFLAKKTIQYVLITYLLVLIIPYKGIKKIAAK